MELLLGVLLVAALTVVIALWLRNDTLKDGVTELEASLVNVNRDKVELTTKLSEATEKAERFEQLAERQSKLIADADRVLEFFQTPVSVVETTQTNTTDVAGQPVYTSVTTEYRAEKKPVKANKKPKKAAKSKPAPKKKAKASVAKAKK